MIRVTLALAPTPSRAVAIQLEPLPNGATIKDALDIARQQPALADLVGPEERLESVGVWGKRALLTTELRDGDRVEIYRPLIADPKLARRRRAANRPSRKM